MLETGTFSAVLYIPRCSGVAVNSKMMIINHENTHSSWLVGNANGHHVKADLMSLWFRASRECLISIWDYVIVDI